ncbi:MAG: hypothetical protein H6696_17190 [Deferribacteres bacterium]|nr:hypothetical protein [candidate division KSB1 bacterium]MCB9503671.1 hypothetical protein [Deferribacteres bacterium]
MQNTLKFFALGILFFHACSTQENKSPYAHVEPIKAHSHNDYQQETPLYSALENGFASIEVDIHLRDGKLCVAHDSADVDTSKTLQSLYLQPLTNLFHNLPGSVFANNQPVLLLIDIKTDADSTYFQLLHDVQKYHTLFYRSEENKSIFGPFRAIISGNRSKTILEEQPSRIAGYDGRITDLTADISPECMPLLSDRWSTHFTWRGQGALPGTEKEKLHEIVSRAHSAGRLVRFWDTDVGDTERQHAIWKELQTAGVDLINTDKQNELREFLLNLH